MLHKSQAPGRDIQYTSVSPQPAVIQSQQAAKQALQGKHKIANNPQSAPPSPPRPPSPPLAPNTSNRERAPAVKVKGEKAPPACAPPLSGDWARRL